MPARPFHPRTRLDPKMLHELGPFGTTRPAPFDQPPEEVLEFPSNDNPDLFSDEFPPDLNPELDPLVLDLYKLV